jgi:hypothetical protein
MRVTPDAGQIITPHQLCIEVVAIQQQAPQRQRPFAQRHLHCQCKGFT